MAEIPTDDSVMQPTMVFKPNDLALEIILLAGVNHPHFINFMLTP
jgi:hypothetical protein